MNWKNLTIGKQITIGFGVVIVLLVVLGSLSFTGVSGIVENAEEVIEGKALDGEMAQKEVDHLNWIGEINKLLNDDSVTELKVQTDHTQCGFGKWLYGEHRKKAEELVPSLAELFKKIEEPHKRLHESAIEIKKVYAAADSSLPGFIAAKLNDHLVWAEKIQTAILDNKEVIKVQTDHRQCDFGKWLYSEKAQQTADSDPALGMIIEQIKEPHLKLHESAKKIISSYRQVHEGLGKTLRMRLDDHRLWMAEVSKGLVNNQVIHVETDPTKCGLGKWLVSDEVAELKAADPNISALLNQIEKPHNELHASVIKINRMIKDGYLDSAKSVFTNETETELQNVVSLLGKVISYEEELIVGREKAIRIFREESEPILAQTKNLLAKLGKQAQHRLDGQQKAASIYAAQTVPNLVKVQSLLGQLRDEVKKNMLTDTAMLKAATGTKRNVAIIGVVAICSGLFLAFVIARGIISILSRITTGMGEGATQVASAAGQVASSSQSMAEGASEQAAAIEQTSSSMEEMSSMTKKNAENAGYADNLMQEANQVVNQANESMDQLTESMKNISKASEETSKIIKTIDEIAFQTNLLALNAAVEAARAGEAGAGFAVVADEVRNLAMRAADAAKNTAQLIEGTVKQIDDGSQLVSNTNSAFEKVSESTSKVGQLVSEISESSKEQSNGIEQVNLAIGEMDKVVQQNAASAEESASASEEMNAQAEQLRDYVSELVMLVTGKKSAATGHIAHHSLKTIEHRPTERKVETRKAISHDKREIRPEQVIPFDDDEDFEDF